MLKFVAIATFATVALGGHLAHYGGGGGGGGYDAGYHGGYRGHYEAVPVQEEQHGYQGGDVYAVATQQSGHYEKEPIYSPQPYKFGYEIVDEYGNKQSRHEVSDEHNVKKGSYSYTDAHGISRRVDYVADAHGFRATIHTNEPGTAASHPADAHYIANPVTSYQHGYHH